MDQIIIRDLKAKGVIGVYEHERQQPQEIIINLVLFANLSRAGESDNLADSIDYQKVADKVLAHTATARRFTVEALAEDIARLCLDVKGVEGVRVRVEKPDAIEFCRSVGVEIERSAAHQPGR